jgi:hypothetical protein
MSIHKTLQVDKLKVLSESLANSSAKAEKRIMENRLYLEHSLCCVFSLTNLACISHKHACILIYRLNTYVMLLTLAIQVVVQFRATDLFGSKTFEIAFSA